MPTPAALPPAIEIFRPGTHVDDQGVARTFTPADVAAMVSAYDPAKREAPLCVGHPEHNLPAYGKVKSLAVNADGRLVMDTRQVEPAFAEMVRTGRFDKRSAAFYPPDHPSNPAPGVWYLRHVAFLGAQPPAIAGLKDIQFADDAAGTVCFSAGEMTAPTKPTQEQDMDEKLEAAQKAQAEAEAKAKAEADARAKAEAEAKEANEKLAQFAEQQRKDRQAGFVSFCEAQVKAGKLLPAQKEPAIAALMTLSDAQPIQFSEAGAQKSVSGAEWLKGLIEGAAPVVQFGEFAGGAGGGQSAKGLSDAEIDAKAKAYATQHKVSYAEALNAVVSFTA